MFVAIRAIPSEAVGVMVAARCQAVPLQLTSSTGAIKPRSRWRTSGYENLREHSKVLSDGRWHGRAILGLQRSGQSSAGHALFLTGKAIIPLSAAILLVVNRVANKIALVPMQPYLLFFAFVQSLMYVAVYSSVLLQQKREGKVTGAMMAFAQRRVPVYTAIGFCEACSLVAVFTATSHLPGAVLPILGQLMMLWSFLLSALVLRKRFTGSQVLGAALVAAGAAIVAGGDPQAALEIDMQYVLLYAGSLLLPAVATILKEKLFADGREYLGGQPLHILCVSTFGSISQISWMLLFFPIMMAQRNIHPSHLGEYLAAGWRALCGASASSAWEAAAPIAFIVANLAFNITAITALRSVGAAAMAIVMTASVPATALAFTFSLPLLGSGGPLPPSYVSGLAVLLAGMLLYNARVFLQGAGIWLPRAEY